MAATAKDFGAQFKKFYTDLSIERKIIFAVLIAGVLAAIYFMAMYASAPKYRVLFSNLNSSSASAIINKLHTYAIPYKLADRGKTILVPKNKVYLTRLKLASAGLPRQEGVGFSIFDKYQIGMTDFIQHVEYQRALQGELERTINELNQVKYSRVIIVLPRHSVFVTRRIPAKASVIIKLRPGTSLSRQEIQGILHLVASSVQGLKSKNITIVDTKGKILSLPHRKNFVYSTYQLSYVKKVERSLENKIDNMLVPVVGNGNVVSKVFVKVNFSKKVESKETYNPNTTAIASQETYKSSSVGAVKPKGVPGAKSNLPPGKIPIPVMTPKKNNVKKVITNYDVSKKIEKISYPVGTIKKIDASVLVNGTYIKIKNKAGKITAKYTPRPASQIALFKNIVKTAIGYSKLAKDKVIVANMPFKKVSQYIPAPPKKTFVTIIKSHLMELIKYFVILIAVLLLILLVLKPLISYITAYKHKEEKESLEDRRGEAIAQLKEQEPPKPEPTLKEVAVNIVHTDPESATNYVKTLLRENGREV
jgi:flagellar M-ring protein FliF